MLIDNHYRPLIEPLLVERFRWRTLESDYLVGPDDDSGVTFGHREPAELAVMRDVSFRRATECCREGFDECRLQRREVSDNEHSSVHLAFALDLILDQVLSRTFCRLGPPIRDFAIESNLYLHRYMLDNPSWHLRFRHPGGGQAHVGVEHSSPEATRVTATWLLEDYDRCVRQIKSVEVTERDLSPEHVAAHLLTALRRCMEWRAGDWDQLIEADWKTYTSREMFEQRASCLPIPRV